MTRILVFGPSTTYGAWDIEGGWVQRLRRYLDEKQLAEKIDFVSLSETSPIKMSMHSQHNRR